MKNSPNTRTCIVCRAKKPKAEMFRFVLDHSQVVLDEDYKLSGRGTYICKSGTCLDTCIKKKTFNKAYKTDIQNYDMVSKIK